MNNKEEIFAEELQRTLLWVSRNAERWSRANGFYECSITPEEMSETIDLLIKEKLYIPLVLFLANDFVGLRGAELMRRILVDLLISQWSEDALNIAMKTLKQTIREYLDKKEIPIAK